MRENRLEDDMYTPLDILPKLWCKPHYLHDIYLIGSLRNPQVPVIENKLAEAGFKVFAEWFAGGELADDAWRDYEKGKGHSFKEALGTYYAKHIFEFDKRHIDRSRIGVLVAPTGRSGHLELGYMLGQGKPGFILIEDDPERFDVMYQFAMVVNTVEELLDGLDHYR